MSRKPKDNVAASRTLTLRLTPDDRARMDRVTEARAAELPERTVSALIRHLVKEAEEAPTPRLPADDRALLGLLVAARAEELARLGVSETEAKVTPSSVLRTLIREAARAKGIAAPAAAQPPAGPSQPAEPPEAPKPAAPDPARVKAAFLAALERGVSQASIAREAGIDSGQLSRFKAKGSGMSPENLEKLADALKKCAS